MPTPSAALPVSPAEGTVGLLFHWQRPKIITSGRRIGFYGRYGLCEDRVSALRHGLVPVAGATGKYVGCPFQEIAPMALGSLGTCHRILEFPSPRMVIPGTAP